MIDVTIQVPWYPCLSKNRSHYKDRKRNRATVAAQKDIAYTLRQQVLPHKWDPEKNIAVTLTVYFKREGTDPHNFVDAIMDALEQGTGINDSMFRPLTVDGFKVKGEFHSEAAFEIRMVQK